MIVTELFTKLFRNQLIFSPGLRLFYQVARLISLLATISGFLLSVIATINTVMNCYRPDKNISLGPYLPS